MRKYFLQIAAALLLIAGCAVMPEKVPAMQKISSHLDPDGAEFSVITAEAWRDTAASLDDAFFSAFPSVDSPEKRKILLKRHTMLRLLADLAGIEYSLGAGFSSKKIAPDYFHNRFFLHMPPEFPGLPGKFLRRGNGVDRSEFLASIPSDAVFAAAADIDPHALLEALENTGSYKDSIIGNFPAALPLGKFAESAAGVWQIVVFELESGGMYIEIPDRENLIFNTLAAIFRQNGSDVTRLDNGSGAVFVKKGERIRMYFTENMEIMVQRASALTVPEKFRVPMEARQPQKCCAAVYSNWRNKCNFESDAGGIRLKSLTSSVPALHTLQSISDGWLLLGNTKLTGTAGILALLLDWIDFLLVNDDEKSDKKGGETVESKSQVTVPAKYNCDCRKKLAEAYAVCKKMVPETGFYRWENSRLLKNSGRNGFFCFGEVKSETPAPLLVSICDDDHFCVCFADGEIASFHLTNTRLLRRIAGFLQTVRRYDEDVFIKLIELAERFDR